MNGFDSSADSEREHDEFEELMAISDEEMLAMPRPPCPICGAQEEELVVPVIYGYVSPDDPLLSEAEQGHVVFGGCIPPPGRLPWWACRRCGAMIAKDGTSTDAVPGGMYGPEPYGMRPLPPDQTEGIDPDDPPDTP
ncbi:MAG: hypothetical protein KatS3mg008_1944 [Acidimicrobiales bacterium]|nr:MAG: hypothetical protein KatS3mg008_1944 [Acidimicrobiales bacterium]